MNLKQLLRYKAATGSQQLEEFSITGNPVTFSTNVQKALTGLRASFTPTQTGTGDPAPDNVRPIYGRTSLNIYHSGEDTTTPVTETVSWQSAQGEVFGGTFDALTGILSIEWVTTSARFGSIIYQTQDTMTQGNMLIDYPVYIAGDTGFMTKHICNVAKHNWAGITNTVPHFYVEYSRTYQKNCAYIILPSDTDPDTTVTICSMLKEPILVQLNAVTIEALVGKNNLWTDTSDQNTVKFLRKKQQNILDYSNLVNKNYGGSNNAYNVRPQNNIAVTPGSSLRMTCDLLVAEFDVRFYSKDGTLQSDRTLVKYGNDTASVAINVPNDSYFILPKWYIPTGLSVEMLVANNPIINYV